MQKKMLRGACTALTTSALLLAASSAMASEAFEGPYLGGKIGWASYDTKISDDDDTLVDGLSASGINTGIIGGIATVNNGWYVGAEANYTVNNADGSLGDDDLDVEESFGLDARLGRVMADNVLLYGLAGWQQTTLEYEVDGLDDDDQSLDGFRFGAGVEFSTPDNVFFRMEYTQTVYNSRDVSIDGMDDDLQLDPDAQAFHLGIGYRF